MAVISSGNYLWWGMSPKRSVFLGKMFADPTIEESQKFFTQPHPWPKTLQKDTIQLSHMSFTTSVTRV
jgi:hypothetical protein